MGFHAVFSCDVCRAVQPILFDRTDETWMEMISAIHAEGWVTALGENARITSCFCPACGPRPLSTD